VPPKEKKAPDDLLDEILPASEKNEGTKNLIRYLFPSFAKNSRSQHEHSDALSRHRPFLTTLRLGLLPGAFSRDEVVSLITSPSEQVQAKLGEAYERGVIGDLIYRIGELYVSLEGIDHVAFWRGVAAFAKKPDCEWMTFYQPIKQAIRDFADILPEAVQKNQDFRTQAATVFTNLKDEDESELTAHWLRRHFYVFGLYENKKRDGNDWFLNNEQTKAVSLEMSHQWRSLHLSGQLIPCRWDLQPVYAMTETGIWDDPCRQALDSTLLSDQALDGFTLMLFGADFGTDRVTIAKMCNYEAYIEHVKKRMKLEGSGEIHETVRLALHRAAEGFFFNL